jgi:hypothetical protein
VKLRVEIEQRRFGWVVIDTQPGEHLADTVVRALAGVYDASLLPFWTDDVTNAARRVYDTQAACALRSGEPVPWCGVHDEPMKTGRYVCWRKAADDANEPGEPEEWWR